MAVDTLGHLLALHITPANEQERAQVAELASQVQEVTGGMVEVAFVDQGYTGPEPAKRRHHGIDLSSSSCPKPKRALSFCPDAGWLNAVFGWTARFRRLTRDYERLCPKPWLVCIFWPLPF